MTLRSLPDTPDRFLAGGNVRSGHPTVLAWSWKHIARISDAARFSPGATVYDGDYFSTEEGAAALRCQRGLARPCRKA